VFKIKKNTVEGLGFQQYFSYIVAVSYDCWRKSEYTEKTTWCKSL